MESTTKTTFPLEVLKKFVKNQFGSTNQIKKITLLTDGRFNTAYDIQFVDDISDIVLRIVPNPDQHVLTYEKEMMLKELLVYKTIQQANIIPAPRLLGYDIEHQLIERDYMFIEKLSGQPFDKIQDRLSATDHESIQHQIGEITASTHSIRSENFGYFGNGTGHGSATWGEALVILWKPS